MKTTDIFSPLTAKALNENLYKQFNVKINFDKYSREQLEDARNKYRSKLFTQESQANFNDLLNNESYQRDKYVLNVLNTRIKEMLGEGKKVDRMVKHIEKSEKASGKSAKKASDIAWATANKRGKLDNKNKKVKEAWDDDDDDVEELTLKESAGYDIVDQLVRKFNMEISGDSAVPLEVRSPGTRVWTRGDGTRYKDPGQIILDPYKKDKWKSEKPVEKFWAWVKHIPGVKDGGQISGEFGSDSSEGFVIFKNLYLSLAANIPAVSWGSASRYKNKKSVWRHSSKDVKEAWDDDDDDVARADQELKRMGKKPIKAAKIDPDKDKIKRTRRDREEENEIDESQKGKSKMKKSVKEHHDLMHKAYQQYIAEGIAIYLAEDEEGKAKAITSAADMVNDFTSWMQRVGNYQTKSMIELADNIRANFGMQEAETFKSSVGTALNGALDALTNAREQINNAVAVLAGEAPEAEPMGQVPSMDSEMDMSSPDQMNSPGVDEFGASDAASGGPETTGRLRRESIERGNRLMKILGS